MNATTQIMIFRGALVAVSLAMTACGGGSSSPPPPVTLQSIAVAPNAPSIAAGLTQQFKATGTYSNNSTADLTSKVSWTSGAATVATIASSSGLAKTLTVGSTVVTAKSGSVSGTATLTVTPAVVKSIAITPNPSYTGIGVTTQLTATGTYTDGSSRDATTASNWTSNAQSVATIGPTGTVTGVSIGSATISAAIGSVTGTAPLSVISGAWAPTTKLIVPAGNLTLLQDGTVLGESRPPVSVAPYSIGAIYNPTAASWTLTGRMSVAVLGETATLLQNGMVLVAGGQINGSGTPTASAEIYDPATHTWTPTANLTTARQEHIAALLPNGRVLVAGGTATSSQSGITTSAEIYDPVAATWTPTASLNIARAVFTATPLLNGTVLVVGGDYAVPGAGPGLPVGAALKSTIRWRPLGPWQGMAAPVTGPRQHCFKTAQYW